MWHGGSGLYGRLAMSTDTRAQDDNMETPGKVCYDAYKDAADGVSLISGDKLPQFEDLTAPVRWAWEAAAKAVCVRYGAIY